MDDNAGIDPLFEIIIVKPQSLCCLGETTLPGQPDRRIPQLTGESRSLFVGFSPNLKMPLKPFELTVEDGRLGFF